MPSVISGSDNFNTANLPISATTANVLTATAGAALNAVGAYRVAFYGGGNLDPGGTTAGSNLVQRTSSGSSEFTTSISNVSESPLSGTWRYMGHRRILYDINNDFWPAGFFLRIS
jgi:hypothetical protein